jgi:hypothetical protein
MRIRAYMMTCAARAQMCGETIQRLLETDWDDPPEVVIDQSESDRPQTRQEDTARRLLELAAGTEGDAFVLFLEDDLAFNRHLRHNLEHWPPLVDVAAGGHFFGSVYNPSVAPRSPDAERACFEAEPSSVYGSQAFLLSSPTARYVVDHWEEVIGMQDIKMSRLAARVTPILYHVPSLVQHVGYHSAWDGSYHRTADYDAEWRAAS